jgi:hypothetical protein
MATAPVVAQHRNWVWVFRVGFFAFGALTLALWFASGFLGPQGPIQGGVLIILSFLIGTAVRNPISWSLLTFTAIGAALPLVGLGLVFGPAGGDQNTFLGGTGFMIVLFGLVFFCASAIATLVVALRVLAGDWRARHAGARPPAERH